MTAALEGVSGQPTITGVQNIASLWVLWRSIREAITMQLRNDRITTNYFFKCVSGFGTSARTSTATTIRGKAVPLQAWSGQEGSRKLMFPDFTTAQDGGKVVSLTHRPPLLPGNAPGTHFR